MFRGRGLRLNLCGHHRLYHGESKAGMPQIGLALTGWPRRPSERGHALRCARPERGSGYGIAQIAALKFIATCDILVSTVPNDGINRSRPSGFPRKAGRLSSAGARRDGLRGGGHAVKDRGIDVDVARWLRLVRTRCDDDFIGTSLEQSDRPVPPLRSRSSKSLGEADDVGGEALIRSPLGASYGAAIGRQGFAVWKRQRV
jgi:hypothetical protein